MFYSKALRLVRTASALVLASAAGCAATETPTPVPAARAPAAPEETSIVCTCPETKSAAPGAPVPVQTSKFAVACSCQPAEADVKAPASAPAAQTLRAEPKAPPAALQIRAVVLFQFGIARLSDAAKVELDRAIIGRLKEFARVDSVRVSGHADYIASAKYNLRLSESRAETVQMYLADKGLAEPQIVTHGYGATQPVQRCTNRLRAALISCLAPNRRVVVEILGTAR